VTHTATLREAGRRADAGDWESAKAWYEAALAESVSAEALEGVARACWWLGEIRAAMDHGQRAFARYEEEKRFAEGAMLGIHLCIWYLTNFDNVAAARGWLSRAKHLADQSGSPVVIGWTDLVAGYLADDPLRGREAIERAAATAEAASDPDLATMALADLGLWHVSSGDLDRGMMMLDEAMAATLAEPGRMLEVVVWSSCNMLAACSLLDDLKRASEWCRAADRFMETYGCPFLQARCRAHYGRVLVATGRWDQAQAELDRALSMTADTGRGPRTEALTALAELRLRQGEPEAALGLLEEADATPWGAVTQAACLIAVGRADEARTLLHGELALHDRKDPAFPAMVAALVEADLSTGRLDEASALVAPEAPVWRAPAFPRAAGLLAHAAGIVAGGQGDQDSARGQLAFALDVFARLELPYEAARTELDLARLLAASDHDAAVARARSAYRRLEALGARREATRAAGFLRSLGITPPPGRRKLETLSGRERDVLTLLAEGLTNPEIAARLYLSRRTVGHHVSSILRKLGLRSRSEAAAYATRHVIRE
jgi:DNA-binding CsgD family transcriptional regulator